MKTVILIILLLFGILTNTRRQSQDVKAEKNVLRYSTSVKTLLYELDSLSELDQTIEFSAVGESGRFSNKFMLCTNLGKTATEKELLATLASPKESKQIKGHAYMAYAFKCDTENRKEKPINYTFKLRLLNGFSGFHKLAFSDFKKYIRRGNGYKS